MKLLANRCVFVVEDEPLVVMLIEDMLQDLGAGAVEIADRLEEAEALAHRTDAAVALLDVDLRGKLSYPVAEILRQRGIPIVFATGYGHDAVRGWDSYATLQKPFTLLDPEGALRRALSA